MSDRRRQAFSFFNEIGIIQQLSGSLFNARMPDGLHVSHFSVLNHLTRLGDGRTPVSIADAFQVTKATMTHTIATLEKRGLISVAPNASDGRSKLVFLTDAGRRYHLKAIASLEPLFELLEAEFDIDKLIAILPVLVELRQFLDAHRDLGR